MVAPEINMKTLEILCVDFLGTDTAICNSAAKNSDFLQFWDTLGDRPQNKYDYSWPSVILSIMAGEP